MDMSSSPLENIHVQKRQKEVTYKIQNVLISSRLGQKQQSRKRYRSMSKATDRHLISKEDVLSCLRLGKKKRNLCFNPHHYSINGLLLGELILVEIYNFIEYSLCSQVFFHTGISFSENFSHSPAVFR